MASGFVSDERVLSPALRVYLVWLKSLFYCITFVSEK